MRPMATSASGTHAGRLLRSGHPLAKLLRFGVIGVLSGVVYAMVTALLVSRLNVAPVLASVIGYCVSVPVSFLGHRRFSFRSRASWTSEAVRFVVTQALNISISAGAMYGAIAWLGTHYGWGMLVAIILVPLTSFIIMNLWVFRDQAARKRAAA